MNVLRFVNLVIGVMSATFMAAFIGARILGVPFTVSTSGEYGSEAGWILGIAGVGAATGVVAVLWRQLLEAERRRALHREADKEAWAEAMDVMDQILELLHRRQAELHGEARPLIREP